MNLVDKIFGTHSERSLKKIEPIINKIESYRDEMNSLSDEELKKKTVYFKKRIDAGETLDEILPEAYAVVREAGKRVLGMEHFHVQLIGGTILHQGRIAEMRTGEGKTLVSTLPAYLHALEGKGVHIITVNDYLAKRDAEQMGAIHRFLGLTVGVITSDMDKTARKAAYDCDITYVTNNELGFDYLRDNMCTNIDDVVQRGLHYCIIDEIDSVLIDEARTPLIISGQSGKSTKLYELCNMFALSLKRGEDLPELTKMDYITGIERNETGDFIVDEKDKIITLTAEGVKKAERYFNIENLADPDNIEIQRGINLALKAHNLMFKDQDYVVDNDEVLIVDSFTGRIMPGRRYSDGLHQAIEAKEHVHIKHESVTLASITFQSFFNKYDMKSGMTGTALTEESEFREIYGLDVVTVPTNKPVQRIDHNDKVYKTKKEKYAAIVEEVKASYKKGQPVLVGTVDIDVSELMSKMLTKEGVPHNVLNAKFHEKEAEIVAEAGKHGAVTIATNMAGRGTDIKLDEDARAAGGLKIIGTERHESRRIDNQLRGRAGRQGDVGESQFFISLEDDTMRLFGSEKMITLFNSLGIEDGMEIQHKMLTDAVEKAQRKIEENNFAARKSLIDYDLVINEQRELVYKQRNRVLAGENMHPQIVSMIENKISNAMDVTLMDETDKDAWELLRLKKILEPIILLPIEDMATRVETKSEFKERLTKFVLSLYADVAAQLPNPDDFEYIERSMLLRTIDRHWMQELSDMELLRQNVRFQSYAQKNPIDEYRAASFDMMDAMNESIIDDVLAILFRIKITKKTEDNSDTAA